MKTLRITICVILFFMVAGCLINTGPKKVEVSGGVAEPFDSILESSRIVGDLLAETIESRGVPADQPILAASFVNIDDLAESSTLGRVISEQIGNRLAQHGFKIIEIKLRRESVYIKKGEGEFFLSRDLRNITAANDVYAVLVGTYAVSDYSVFVSARIVLTEDNTVIAGREYELSLDFAVQSLLEKREKGNQQ